MRVRGRKKLPVSESDNRDTPAPSNGRGPGRGGGGRGRGARKFRFIVEILCLFHQETGEAQKRETERASERASERERERERGRGRSSATTILLWNGAGSYFSGTSAARAARRQVGIIR